MIRPAPDKPVRLGGGRLPSPDADPTTPFFWRCGWGECGLDGRHQVLARRNRQGASFFLSQTYCWAHAKHYAEQAEGNGFIDVQVLEIR